jgi:hypothetical protein
MRRCMSDRVGKDGRVFPSKGLDVMIWLLARFRIGVEGRMTQAYMTLPGPGPAFYRLWSGVSIRLLKGAFSFLSARPLVPGKGGSEDLPVGDS